MNIKPTLLGHFGGFVRIPQGYHDLYGIVADVGAHAAPATPQGRPEVNDRWMTIQRVAEIVGISLEQGIGQYPNVRDEVHLVTEEDLAVIYGTHAREFDDPRKPQDFREVVCPAARERLPPSSAVVDGSGGRRAVRHLLTPLVKRLLQGSRDLRRWEAVVQIVA